MGSLLAKTVLSGALALLTGVLWFLTTQYEHPYLTNSFNTALTITIVYVVFKVILEEMLTGRIKDPKSRYSIRKAVSIIYIVILTISVVTVWIPNPEALLVAYGIVAAGIAISLQDLFKNFAGGIMIYVSRPLSVGDRIEIDSRFGDVLDIGLLYTTIMETRQWVGGDQATGRIITIPNSYVLTTPVHNYTKDHNFIWDEIVIPITYSSDWKAAETLLKDIVNRETSDMIKSADRQLANIEEKYYFQKRAVEPQVFLAMTDNWVRVSVRYVTDARRRRLVNGELSRHMLEAIQKSKNIKIASQTIDIVGFPQQKGKAKSG